MTLHEETQPGANDLKEAADRVFVFHKKFAEAARTQNDTLCLKLDATTKAVVAVTEQSLRLTDEMASQTKGLSSLNDTASSLSLIVDEVRALSGDLDGEMTDMVTAYRDTGNVTRQSEARFKALQKSLDSLVDFLKSINDIAETTTILAMNAAIQAAHAGERGRGFAVVAGEIRKLSVTSNDQAAQAGRMIKEIRDAVTTAVDGMKKTTATLAGVEAHADRAAASVSALRGAMNKQTERIRDIEAGAERARNASAEIHTAGAEFNAAVENLQFGIIEASSLSKTSGGSLRKIIGLQDEIGKLLGAR